MAVLVSAQNLITLFLGIELLSIPLYVLCASEYRREGSLESGLKYLVIGSVGSATLVYGLALVYGATGSTDFSGIASALSPGQARAAVLGDPLLFTGLALVIVGFAFKASVAPFHQWTPDVYEGAPTPITAFMATATKAAALGVFLRFFDVAAIGAQNTWAPLLAAIAAITMIVGNVGALGQSSLKRMLGYSGVAQAGYMLGGVVVGTQLGIQATVLYLIVYLAMNIAAFAVIVRRRARRGRRRRRHLLAGRPGRAQPWLAWPMTIAMLALAGIPGTVGFIGKFQLIHALVAGDYTWLAIVLVIGSMISLGYYLRVVATMWMPRRSSAAAAGADAAALRSDRRRVARGGRARGGATPGEAGRRTRGRSTRGRRSPQPPRPWCSWPCSPVRPACSSGSSPRRCSTSPPTPGTRSAVCSRSRPVAPRSVSSTQQRRPCPAPRSGRFAARATARSGGQRGRFCALTLRQPRTSPRGG